MLALLPHPARLRKDICQVASFTVSVASLLAATTAFGADEYFKRRVLDHEQCANVCQEDFDTGLSACMPYRKDRLRTIADDCDLVATDRYEQCLRRCPEDPRPNEPYD